ncbi:MAG: acyl-CoA desaturase [Acidobacteria bacterium]|nr:MAG: acyl-CoA desaturase [Acidobacteriota bacterium]
MPQIREVRAVKITFARGTGFHSELKQRVERYFKERGIGTTGDARIFVKSAIILTAMAASYIFLVFFAASWPGALLGVLAMSQTLALVGLNIQHDGNHGSYSKSKRVNWVMGFTIDVIGGSHFLWRQKHNILHHTYTNIDELDDDLHTTVLLRFSPDQKLRPWHRFQHWYAFPIYSLLTLSWVTVGDVRKLITGRIGNYRLNPLSWKDLTLFVVMRSLYFCLALGLPLYLHPVSYVLAAFLGVHLLLGFTLAMVFQLAHTVDGNTFPAPVPGTSKIENEWAIHEIETTADFARANPLVSWYLGGLNFQIEHHLFPRICHVHYPEISKIVEATCVEFGISYLAFPSIFAAVKAHVKHLKAMGRAPVSSPAPGEPQIVGEAPDSVRGASN